MKQLMPLILFLLFASLPSSFSLAQEPSLITSSQVGYPSEMSGKDFVDSEIVAAEEEQPPEEEAQGGLIPEPPPGISFGFAYVAESVSLLAGDSENRDFHYLDNIDLQFEFDTEGLGLWRGGTIFTYFMANSGADPSAWVGDAQVTSNIEANDTQRLYELWYNQSLFGGTLEVLVGIHDLNSEYYTNETSSFFNNSSFGIGADLSANCPVGIFNVAALGARLRFAPSDQFAIQASIYDGDPGDPDENHNGLKVDFGADQGLFAIVETQYAPETVGFEAGIPQTYRMGGWYHTAEFESIVEDSTVMVSGNYGVYFSIDQPLNKWLTSFIHGGFAAGDRSAVPAYMGLGFQTTPGTRRILFKRFEQTFGLAVGAAFIQQESNNEIVIEATWHMQLNDFLSIKPDFQYIISPGGSRDAENALVFSIRTEIGL